MLLVVSCGRTAQHAGDPATVGGGGAQGGSSNVGGTSLGGGSGVGGGDPPLSCPGTAPPDMPLRPLAAYELENELRQLDAQLDSQARGATRSRIFNEEPERLTPQFLSEQSYLAERVARAVASDPSKLEKLTGCVIADEASCRQKVIEFVLRRLFRGLGSPESQDELEATFDEGQRVGGDFESGIRATLEVALQSPEFLYRFELGRPATDRDAPWAEPTDLEMASRLSFLIWDAGPDEALLAAGEAGELSAPKSIEAHARRMLEDPRAAGPVARFHRELLGANPPSRYNTTAHPELTPTIYELMRQELDHFVVDATFSGAGNYQALFAPHTFVNDVLSKFYGHGFVASEELHRVELDPTRYAGLLSMGAWLTTDSHTYSNPALRGYAISRGLLCHEIPLPPPDVQDGIPETPSVSLTTRQRYEQHTASPICHGCHRLMDPIGFGLEHFDATGRWRDDEAGMPIDSSGSATLAEGEVAFDGAAELAAALLASSGARDCYVKQWQRFAFGRQETEVGGCTHLNLLEAFQGSAENVRELIVALTQTESFRYRRVQEGQP